MLAETPPSQTTCALLVFILSTFSDPGQSSICCPAPHLSKRSWLLLLARGQDLLATVLLEGSGFCTVTSDLL